MKKLFYTIFFIFLISSTSFAQLYGDLVNLDRQELLYRSWITPSANERTRIRKFIADNYPNTAEGLMSKGHLLGMEGKADEAQKYYMAAIKKAPNNPMYYIKARSYYVRKKEYYKNIDLLKESLKVNPSFDHYYAIQIIFDSYLYDLKDKDKAFEFVDNIRDEFGNLGVIDYLKGEYYYYNIHDYQKALDYFSQAISKEDMKSYYDAWRLFVKSKIKANRANPEAKFMIFKEVLSEIIDLSNKYPTIENKILTYKMLKFVGDSILEETKKTGTNESIKLYKAAFQYYPTAEILKKISDERFVDNIMEIDEYVKENAKFFGNDSLGYYLLGKYFSHYDNPEKAHEYFKKSLKYSAIISEKYRAIDAINYLYSTYYLTNKKVEKLYYDILGANKDVQIYFDLAWYALQRNDLKTAEKFINKFDNLEKRKDKNVKELKDIYKYLTKLELEVKSFYGKGTFGQYWSNNYADGLRININFQTGSAQISKQDYNKLIKLGKFLSQKSAKNYAFIIEGHTDNTGSDQLNKNLSEKRAIAVVRFLNEKSGISLSRLKAIGYGSKYPVDTNTTEKGRRHNRRVEITLSGSVDKPVIKATTSLTVDWAEISPDDKYLLSGYLPMKLWDLNKKITLKTFDGYHRIRKFSPNGKYIAAVKTTVDSRDKFNSLVIYNRLTLKPEKYYNFYGKISSMAWSPYGDSIVVRTRQAIHVINVRKNTHKYKYTNHYIGAIGNIVWLKKNNLIALNYKNPEGAIRIYSGNDLSLVKDITGAWFHGLGKTKNGKYLVATTNSGDLYSWNTDNWSYKQMQVDTVSGFVLPVSNNIVLIGDFGRKKKIIQNIDIENLKVIGSKQFSDHKPYLSMGDHMVAVYDFGEEDEVKILDKKTLNQVDVLEGATSKAQKIYADSKNNLVVTKDFEGIHVWNLKDGHKLHIWKGDFKNLIRPDFFPSNEFLAIEIFKERKQTILYKLNTDDMSKTEVLNMENFVPKLLNIMNKKLVVAGNEYKETNEDIKDSGSILIIDLYSGKIEKSFELPLITGVLNYYRLPDANFRNISITDDFTKVLYTTYWKDGWGMGYSFSDNAILYDLVEDNEICRADYNYKTDDDQISIIDSNSFVIKDTVFSMQNCTKKETVSDFDDFKNSLKFYYTKYSAKFEDLGFKIELTEDNKINFYNKNNNLFLTIINKKNNEWIAYSNEGYYTSSLNGDKGMVWFLAGRILPFEEVKTKMNKPSLIKTMLNNFITGQDKKVIKGERLSAKVFSSPYHIQLISPAKLNTKENIYEMKLDIEIIGKNVGKPKLIYTQNGRRLNERALLPKSKNNHIKVIKEFKLEDGENEIIAYIDYGGNLINPVKAVVIKQVNENDFRKKELWFLSIGVSKYAKSSQNLNYADKDAITLAKEMKNQEGKLFSKVHTLTLTNSDATVTNIKRAVHKFLKQAKQDDIVVLFVAGHGIQDDDNSLYFVAYDTDGDEPYTGLEVSYFDNFLRKRPAGQKAIFWMDICHAGSYGSTKPKVNLTAEEAVKLLADGTDTVVFASSSGREASLESKEYGGGHGAFTYALLSGLRGDADLKMGDRDGFVNLLELTFFVAKKVPKFTNDQQHPTIPYISHLRDYPIAIY